MSETSGTPADLTRSPAGARDLEVVHEAYSFACMRCGHVWEQAYDIEHHIDAAGQTVLAYRAGGRRVPSPLTRPNCVNCGAHLVRIMQAGTAEAIAQCAQVIRPAEGPRATRRTRDKDAGVDERRRPEDTEQRPAPQESGDRVSRAHHWRLRLPHFLHRKPRDAA